MHPWTINGPSGSGFEKYDMELRRGGSGKSSIWGGKRAANCTVHICESLKNTFYKKLNCSWCIKTDFFLQKSSWTSCVSLVTQAAMQIVKVAGNMVSVVVIKIILFQNVSNSYISCHRGDKTNGCKDLILSCVLTKPHKYQRYCIIISVCHKPGPYILPPHKIFAWAPCLNNSCWAECPD